MLSAMYDAQQTDIIDFLKKRRIRVMRAAAVPGFDGIALSMSVFDIERFLDVLVPPPGDSDDVLFPRIIGRPADLGVEDESWSFELVPGHVDAGFEFHAIANIPGPDVDTVLWRLRSLDDDPA